MTRRNQPEDDVSYGIPSAHYVLQKVRFLQSAVAAVDVEPPI